MVFAFLFKNSSFIVVYVGSNQTGAPDVFRLKSVWNFDHHIRTWRNKCQQKIFHRLWTKQNEPMKSENNQTHCGCIRFIIFLLKPIKARKR